MASSSQSALLSGAIPGKSCESEDDDEDLEGDEEDNAYQPTGFDRFNDAAEFDKLIDVILEIQRFSLSATANASKSDKGDVDAIDRPTPTVNRIHMWQVQVLKMDVDYIKNNIDGLRRSSRKRERAEKLIQRLMDAAQGDPKPDSPNFKKLLQAIARLKLLVPRPEDNGLEIADNTKKKKKKKKNPSTEAKTAAAEIIKAMLKPKIQQVDQADLLRSYESLNLIQKKCLLCFSILDFKVDNEQQAARFIEIKRKVLIHWWVGEGFIKLHHDQESAAAAETVPCSNPEASQRSKKEKTVEDIGKQILKVLTEKGFIAMGTEKGRETGVCRMRPLVHSFLTQRIMKADHIVNSDDNDDLRPLFTSACLVRSQDGFLSSCQLWAKYTKSIPPEKLKMFEKVPSLFNVNESIAYIKPEWLSKMKILSVLHLGRWRSGTTNHIEFADQKFLQELKNLKQIRLFSLQGVSSISKLPDSVCELANLEILDLRECHQLEELPSCIGSLKSLTHLDISGCHLLTKLPIGISSLSKLVVLRGFVIYNKPGNRQEKKLSFIGRRCKSTGKVCSFWDLRKLKKLGELSLVVEKKSFPDSEELCVFKEMQNLRKLKITWQRSLKSNGYLSKDQQDGKSKHACIRGSKNAGQLSNQEDEHNKSRSGYLSKIEKLELWCFPLKTAPDWLVPEELKNLKKLYIKGGQLQLLSRNNYENEWGVTTLRVKYLPNLIIRWTDLRAMFPMLTYFEKFECKKLCLFPCDHQGVWRLEN